MKSISSNIKRRMPFLLFMSSMTFMILTNCSKENVYANCSTCAIPSPYHLEVDFPPVQTPGCLTLMKATVLGDITYPISITWYASKDLYPQSLQRVDTLTSGNKAWFSFMFPSLYKASLYNRGPYYIRCVVNKVNPEAIEMLIEKTVGIKSAK